MKRQIIFSFHIPPIQLTEHLDTPEEAQATGIMVDNALEVDLPPLILNSANSVFGKSGSPE